MEGVCKVVEATEVECKPHKFYEHLKYSLHDLHSIYPEAYTDSQILEGDGKSVGTLRQWKYINPGTSEEEIVIARTTKQDDVNMFISWYVEEGAIHGNFKHFEVTCQVSPNGEGSKVTWTVEFEKHHDQVQDPHHYMELYKGLGEKLGAHAHKA